MCSHRRAPIRPLHPDPIEAFLARWDGTEQAERANYVAFLNESAPSSALPCQMRRGAVAVTIATSVAPPITPTRALRRRGGSTCTAGIASFWKRSRAPILAARHLFSARRRQSADRTYFGPASGHGRCLRPQGRRRATSATSRPTKAAPPFLIVCDVGFCFDLYADFSGTGRHYVQSPDREGFGIYLPESRDPAKRGFCVVSGKNPIR
jgi:hypothetical protein